MKRLDLILSAHGAATDLPELRVERLVSDSRQARDNDAFFALRGLHSDGLDFAMQAVTAGAKVVVCGEREQLPRLPVPVVCVPLLEAHLGAIAAAFYQLPAEHRLVGVTGTNGKSSCAYFLAQAWEGGGMGQAGFIGTLGQGRLGQLEDHGHTTPGVLTLHHELARQHAAGIDLTALEVSSHALDQQRVAGLRFSAGIFTNLSRDHLDYHGTMQAYGAAKARLFSDHPEAVAVINIDDEYGRQLVSGLTPGRALVTYSMQDPGAMVYGQLLQISDRGLRLSLRTPWGAGEVTVPVLGRFQAGNLLAVAAVLGALGCPLERILQSYARLTAAPGRMQALPRRADQPLVLVDYAHTPDALAQALATAREITRGELWCVFGCGGDRDRGKRPQMGAAVAANADHAVLTSDNPRSEPPETIIDEIAAGMMSQRIAHRDADRARAIAYAISHAQADDVVVVAGKGHEHYQEAAGQRQPFDDVECARRALEQAA
ncbi:MAG: UDP-N-acetylmuramoyl-L-alanyl-D-glutamate--2,6-diaminopimelate ligase [Wenzhouxiangellaceae bacterium]